MSNHITLEYDGEPNKSGHYYSFVNGEKVGIGLSPDEAIGSGVRHLWHDADSDTLTFTISRKEPHEN